MKTARMIDHQSYISSINFVSHLGNSYEGLKK